MQFWTKIVAAFPDELVRDLIAHELAHVYQYAIGLDFGDDNYGCEEDADWTLERWGFSATAIDDWLREHGMRLTNPILMAMLRSPRTDLSVSRRCPHGETRWETT